MDFRGDRAFAMESLYLKTLIEVVEAGSFSRAAETLFISQSAVYRRIRFLEEQYGVPLIDRSSPSPHPTAAGRIVIEKARRILSLENELLRGLDSLKGKRELTFCCTPAFGSSYLPQVLHTFMGTNPQLVDVKFVFDAPERIVKGLRNGLFDLAVIEHCDHFNLGGFSAVPLPGDEMVFVGSRAMGLPPGEVDLELLLEKPLLVRKEGACSRTLLEWNLARIGRNLSHFHKMAIVDDVQVTLNAVLHGGPLSFLSYAVVRDRVVAGALTVHRVREFQHTRRRTLVSGNGADDCPTLTDFRNAVLGAFEDAVCPALTASGEPPGPGSSIDGRRDWPPARGTPPPCTPAPGRR
jgi:LysR family transcriptional regulator, transcriptional activator of the cysJI operon